MSEIAIGVRWDSAVTLSSTEPGARVDVIRSPDGRSAIAREILADGSVGEVLTIAVLGHPADTPQ